MAQVAAGNDNVTVQKKGIELPSSVDEPKPKQNRSTQKIRFADDQPLIGGAPPGKPPLKAQSGFPEPLTETTNSLSTFSTAAPTTKSSKSGASGLSFTAKSSAPATNGQTATGYTNLITPKPFEPPDSKAPPGTRSVQAPQTAANQEAKVSLLPTGQPPQTSIPKETKGSLPTSVEPTKATQPKETSHSSLSKAKPSQHTELKPARISITALKKSILPTPKDTTLSTPPSTSPKETKSSLHDTSKPTTNGARKETAVAESLKPTQTITSKDTKASVAVQPTKTTAPKEASQTLLGSSQPPKETSVSLPTSVQQPRATNAPSGHKVSLPGNVEPLQKSELKDTKPLTPASSPPSPTTLPKDTKLSSPSSISRLKETIAALPASVKPSSVTKVTTSAGAQPSKTPPPKETEISSPASVPPSQTTSPKEDKASLPTGVKTSKTKVLTGNKGSASAISPPPQTATDKEQKKSTDVTDKNPLSMNAAAVGPSKKEEATKPGASPASVPSGQKIAESAKLPDSQKAGPPKGEVTLVSGAQKPSPAQDLPKKGSATLDQKVTKPDPPKSDPSKQAKQDPALQQTTATVEPKSDSKKPETGILRSAKKTESKSDVPKPDTGILRTAKVPEPKNDPKIESKKSGAELQKSKPSEPKKSSGIKLADKSPTQVLRRASIAAVAGSTKRKESLTTLSRATSTQKASSTSVSLNASSVASKGSKTSITSRTSRTSLISGASQTGPCPCSHYRSSALSTSLPKGYQKPRNRSASKVSRKSSETKFRRRGDSRGRAKDSKKGGDKKRGKARNRGRDKSSALSPCCTQAYWTSCQTADIHTADMPNRNVPCNVILPSVYPISSGTSSAAYPICQWQPCCQQTSPPAPKLSGCRGMGTQWNPCYTVNPACTPQQQSCCPGGSPPVCRTIAWDPVYTSPAATAVVANSPPTFQNQQPVNWSPDCCSPQNGSYMCTAGCRNVDCELAVGAKSLKPTVKPASREMPDNFKMIHTVHQKYLGRGGEVLGRGCDIKQLLTVGSSCCSPVQNCCPPVQNCCPPPRTTCVNPCPQPCCPPPCCPQPCCPQPCCPPPCPPVRCIPTQYTPACQPSCPPPCQPFCSPSCLPYSPCGNNCSPVFGCPPLRRVTSEEVRRDRKCMLERNQQRPTSEIQRIFAYRRQLELERECQESQMQCMPQACMPQACMPQVCMPQPCMSMYQPFRAARQAYC